MIRNGVFDMKGVEMNVIHLPGWSLGMIGTVVTLIKEGDFYSQRNPLGPNRLNSQSSKHMALILLPMCSLA